MALWVGAPHGMLQHWPICESCGLQRMWFNVFNSPSDIA